jgi:hypothetical protein
VRSNETGRSNPVSEEIRYMSAIVSTPIGAGAKNNSEEFMHAALVTNLPNYASAIVITSEMVEAISALERVPALN